MSTFASILSEVADLKAKKSQDYQGSSISQAEYFPYGQVSFNHMLHTKILRIRSVSDQGGSQNFESLEDSLKDLIAYATMNIEWIRDQESPVKADLTLPSGDQPSGITRGMDIDAYEASLDIDYKRGKIGSQFYYAQKSKLKGD